MARLTIHLLGAFHAAVDGVPVSGFESEKVRALLAYLAVDSDRDHRRERSAGLQGGGGDEEQGSRGAEETGSGGAGGEHD